MRGHRQLHGHVFAHTGPGIGPISHGTLPTLRLADLCSICPGRTQHTGARLSYRHISTGLAWRATAGLCHLCIVTGLASTAFRGPRLTGVRPGLARQTRSGPDRVYEISLGTFLAACRTDPIFVGTGRTRRTRAVSSSHRVVTRCTQRAHCTPGCAHIAT